MHRYLVTAICVLLVSTRISAEDWPGFLGPGGSAKSPDVVPTTWADSENVAWKVDLPGTGSSSPIIVGDKLLLTCYVAKPDAYRAVLCFNKDSGERLWSTEFPVDYREDQFQGYITEHGYASNTPVSDGQNVYAFLGKGGVHSINLEGKVNWSVDVGKESSNRRWGSAASLLLCENKVIVNAAEESQSIIALDKTTGAEIWKQEAAMLELTYATPRIVTRGDGHHEIVISVPEEMWSLDPTTGTLNWFCKTPMSGNVCPSVIVHGETIYSFGGYQASGSIAVRAGGKEDVSDSHIIWTNRSSSYVATPLLHNNRFYWIDDRGIAHCTSAGDGGVVYRTRVGDLENGRPVYASPVLVGDHIYVVTRNSGTIVYQPGDSFEPIARNVFSADASDFNATPAVSDGKLYLRSNQRLYCISNLR